MKCKCVIIGGGAAGLMAAGAAAEKGAEVLIIEKNKYLGRKLRITGKGRCNVTNNCDRDAFFENIPVNPRFLYSAYSAFDKDDTMNFFESLGVPLKTERGNRVFPVSDKADDIAAAFERVISEKKITVKKGNAENIKTENGKITGVTVGGKFISADSVIIATGGRSYPATGSDGSGYTMAESLGHTVVQLKPSLVPIVSEEKYCCDMMGLSLKNVKVTLFDTVTKKKIYSELGEMLFTHFGVSGPLILSASSHIRNLERGRFKLFIDLKPGLDEKKLDSRISRDFAESPNREIGNVLRKLLPAKIIPPVTELSGIPADKKVNQISRGERIKLMETLKNFPVTVRAFRPIDEAIITSGGVSTSEINPKTMESKLVKGLYFAGEIIDVDAYTGGFNLQIAFSTGYAAGVNAAEQKGNLHSWKKKTLL